MIMAVRRLAFGARRLALGVWRSAFGARRLVFGVRRCKDHGRLAFSVRGLNFRPRTSVVFR
jgi:hypothetical protein